MVPKPQMSRCSWEGHRAICFCVKSCGAGEVGAATHLQPAGK